MMYFTEGYRAKPSVHTCGKGQRTQLRPPAHTEKKKALENLFPNQAIHVNLSTEQE